MRAKAEPLILLNELINWKWEESNFERKNKSVVKQTMKNMPIILLELVIFPNCNFFINNRIFYKDLSMSVVIGKYIQIF
jgi:hypothetical protein